MTDERAVGETQRIAWVRTVLVVLGSEKQRHAFISGYNGTARPKRCSETMRRNYDLGIEVRDYLTKESK